MSKRNYRLFISDIKESTGKILNYTAGKTYSEFINDQMLVDAVIRNMEIIGEATNNLSNELKQKYHQIEWRKIADLRNIVIHGYFRIDYEVLWDIIQHKIPDLKEKIQEILKTETNK